MSDRILVTGAAGFMGQHLVERLVDDGHQITALDIEYPKDVSYSDHIGDSVDYHRGSILHEQFVDNVVFPSPNYYDKVFHLAAIVGVDRYVDVDDPLYLVNVNINGTRNVLDRIRGSETHLVYTSTSEVYGMNESLPWEEDDHRVVGPTTESRWSYSSTKAVCEHMIHMMADNGDIRGSVVRPFNLYGPYQRPDFVIPKFVSMALDGVPPTVYGTGTQRRCFTYIDDFIDGLVAVSERDQNTPRTYNLGGNEETEIGDLARKIVDLTDLPADPEYVTPGEDLDGDYEEPDRRIPDTTRSKECLGWEATTGLDGGLASTVEAMRARRDSDSDD